MEKRNNVGKEGGKGKEREREREMENRVGEGREKGRRKSVLEKEPSRERGK